MIAAARGRLLCSLLLCGLLTACATSPKSSSETRQPVRVPNTTTSAPPSSGSSSATPSTVPNTQPSTSKRGGGYYKDDGPGENIPPNLAEIPDATPKKEALHRYANRPYVALGQTYVPKQELRPFVERGIASWYGKRFHGVRTSSGEPYDMYAMTAAHPTLPIPSYARVTRLSNGRSVIVRINDRGPFHKNRIMDLSYAAAWKLDYVNVGSAEVEVEAILPEDVAVIASNIPPLRRAESVSAMSKSVEDVTPTALPSLSEDTPLIPSASNAMPTPFGSVISADLAPSGTYLQLGAFSSNSNAESFGEYVQTELKWSSDRLLILLKNEKFRLQAGPFDSLQTAIDAAELIEKKLKFKPFIVQR